MGRRIASFFLNLVKTNQEKALIRTLKISDETIIDRTRILDEISNFYEKLYTSKGTEPADAWIGEIRATTDIPTITDDSKDELVKEMTISDLQQIIKSCPINKSPGNDGLPKEFYVVF